MTPRQKIAQIDKAIDAVLREARNRAERRPINAGDWQDVWDENPDLNAQHSDLYRQRGIAQRERDMLETTHRIRVARRPLRKKKCPACGSYTYAA